MCNLQPKQLMLSMQCCRMQSAQTCHSTDMTHFQFGIRPRYDASHVHEWGAKTNASHNAAMKHMHKPSLDKVTKGHKSKETKASNDALQFHAAPKCFHAVLLLALTAGLSSAPMHD